MAGEFGRPDPLQLLYNPIGFLIESGKYNTSQGYSPLGPGWGLLSGTGQQWSQDEIRIYEQKLAQARDSGQIDENEYQLLSAQMKRGVQTGEMGPNQFGDVLDNAVEKFRTDKSRAEAEQSFRDTKSQLIPKYQQEVDRLYGVLNTPEGLRSDAQFANALAQQENAISAGVNQSQQNLTRMGSQRGVSHSGKLFNQGNIYEMLGQQQKGQAYAGLLGQAREGYRTALGDLANIQGAQFGQGINLAQYQNPRYGQNVPLGIGTSSDISAGNQGLGLQYAGLASSTALGALGAGQNTVGQITGMFRKG